MSLSGKSISGGSPSLRVSKVGVDKKPNNFLNKRSIEKSAKKVRISSVNVEHQKHFKVLSEISSRVMSADITPETSWGVQSDEKQQTKAGALVYNRVLNPRDNGNCGMIVAFAGIAEALKAKKVTTSQVRELIFKGLDNPLLEGQPDTECSINYKKVSTGVGLIAEVLDSIDKGAKPYESMMALMADEESCNYVAATIRSSMASVLGPKPGKVGSNYFMDYNFRSIHHKLDLFGGIPDQETIKQRKATLDRLMNSVDKEVDRNEHVTGKPIWAFFSSIGLAVSSYEGHGKRHSKKIVDSQYSLEGDKKLEAEKKLNSVDVGIYLSGQDKHFYLLSEPKKA